MWNQSNRIKEGWSQDRTPYPPNREPSSPPVCPNCGEPLDKIDEDAEASAVVYYRGTIIREWVDDHYEYYDSDDWENIESDNWEENGLRRFYCPNCGEDVTELVDNLV